MANLSHIMEVSKDPKSYFLGQEQFVRYILLYSEGGWYVAAIEIPIDDT